MGLQKKHGKGRLDKWYKLAKEKGYRARAAFKLIQLNRKYGFLEKSKVLLDLCAAPGSWCQVAVETMPANSLIVGVDLAPIKPIPKTITFQSDITTDKCRATIRQHFKSWKADTVLHDGAPNVGISWTQDAFSQVELALQAFKLATEFLVEGGTFVTKVFRSRDYNALLWVFNQLFTKVEATKPPSSRNVSAEVFVVCRGFKAPRYIDPKFLDPRSVFAELPDPTPNNEAKVFNPERQKRKRDGFEEGNYIQFKEASAYDFIQTTHPIAMLGDLSRLSLDLKGKEDVALAALNNLSETTAEIRQCCMDLKVLGRKEFRALLRWRLKARAIFGFASKKNEVKDTEDENVVEIRPMDEELQIQEDLQKLAEKEKSYKKREKRRENERRQKDIVRMQMHMMAPTDIGLEQNGPTGKDSTFSIAGVNKSGVMGKVVRGKMGVLVPIDPADDGSQTEESDEEEDRLDSQLDAMYEAYQEKKSESNAKYRAKKARKEHADGDWEGFSDGEEKSEDDLQLDADSDSSSEDETNEPIINSDQAQINAESTSVLTRRASLFFEQDIFKDLGGLEDDLDAKSSYHLKTASSGHESQPSNTGAISSSVNSDLITGNKDEAVAAIGEALSIENGFPPQTPKDFDLMNNEGPMMYDNDDDDSNDGFETVPVSNGNEWEIEDDQNKKEPVAIEIITAEAMSLAQQIASGEKSKYDLIDEGFNKYAFQDRDGLPEWFLDDEGLHNKPLRPITAAGAAAIKEKLRALNARPIKKVREAKARKKFKAAQRLEKLRKKSALIAGDDAVSEKDKAQSIAKLMSKAAKKKPKQQVKLVVAVGGNRGIPGRPRGVKGKYKIVDARLKKDVRAEKRLAKKRR